MLDNRHMALRQSDFARTFCTSSSGQSLLRSTNEARPRSRRSSNSPHKQNYVERNQKSDDDVRQDSTCLPSLYALTVTYMTLIVNRRAVYKQENGCSWRNKVSRDRQHRILTESFEVSVLYVLEQVLKTGGLHRVEEYEWEGLPARVHSRAQGLRVGRAENGQGAVDDRRGEGSETATRALINSGEEVTVTSFIGTSTRVGKTAVPFNASSHRRVKKRLQRLPHCPRSTRDDGCCRRRLPQRSSPHTICR